MEDLWLEVSRKCLIKASEIAGEVSIGTGDTEAIGRLVDAALSIHAATGFIPLYRAENDTKLLGSPNLFEMGIDCGSVGFNEKCHSLEEVAKKLQDIRPEDMQCVTIKKLQT